MQQWIHMNTQKKNTHGESHSKKVFFIVTLHSPWGIHSENTKAPTVIFGSGYDWHIRTWHDRTIQITNIHIHISTHKHQRAADSAGQRHGCEPDQSHTRATSGPESDLLSRAGNTDGTSGDGTSDGMQERTKLNTLTWLFCCTQMMSKKKKTRC